MYLEPSIHNLVNLIESLIDRVVEWVGSKTHVILFLQDKHISNSIGHYNYMYTRSAQQVLKSLNF